LELWKEVLPNKSFIDAIFANSPKTVVLKLCCTLTPN